MRILMLGAGVIGSVYAGGLLDTGNEVVLFARGRRLAELQQSGLVLQRADTGHETVRSVDAISELNGAGAFDLVVVPVRADQLTSTFEILEQIPDGTDVLFFGNYAGRLAELFSALQDRFVLGFPAVGGVRDGHVVRYVPISQQRTMLGEPDGHLTPRIQRLASLLREAGFATAVSNRMDAWLLGHAAFLAPIGCALQLADIDAGRLAGRRDLLHWMVLATRQGFRALDADHQVEIPANLRMLYLRLPTAFAVAYWKRVMAGPRGELWFATHTRAAPEEMNELAATLRESVQRAGHTAPDLMRLLDAAQGSQH